MFSFEDTVSAEISNFDTHMFIQETVLDFQVPMCDPCTMHGLQPVQNLPKKLTTNIRKQPVRLLHQIKELAILGQLRHQVKLLPFRSPLPPNLIEHFIRTRAQTL